VLILIDWFISFPRLTRTCNSCKVARLTEVIPAFPIVAQELGHAKYVQQSANAREKEYGRDRKLNDVRDLINFIHEHLLSSSGKSVRCDKRLGFDFQCAAIDSNFLIDVEVRGSGTGDKPRSTAEG
jgi:hypothetical protein